MRSRRLQNRLTFEALESRFVLDAGLEISVKANSEDITKPLPPRIALNSEITFDIQVTNKKTDNYDDAMIDLIHGGTDPISVAPVLVERLWSAPPLATYPISALRFLSHPTEPILFATIPASNSLAIFNTQTLEMLGNFWVGSQPYGLAISNDGNVLYVANSTSNFISVVDWRGQRVLRNIRLPQVPLDVEVGADGRLYVLTNSSLTQIDPETGGKVGPDFWVYVYSGELVISPNKDRLYYGNHGLSPASLYQWDITGPNPILLWESDHGITSGANGQDLAISSDGAFVSYATGGGQIGYDIAKYRTDDMAIMGTFNTGPYPTEITFSPDGLTAYAIHTRREVKVFDTNSFLLKSIIKTEMESNFNHYEMMVDSSGQKLFISDDSKINVYYTDYERRFFNVGDVNHNGKFEPGESWSFVAKGTAKAALQSIKVQATLQNTDGISFTTSIHGSYTGVGSPQFAFFVDGIEVGSESKPNYLVGQAIQYSFRVTNPFSVTFGNVRVRLDNGTPAIFSDDIEATFFSGDTNGDRLLGPNETWLFRALGTALKDNVTVLAMLETDMTDNRGVKLEGQIPGRVNQSFIYFGIHPSLSTRFTVQDKILTSPDVLFTEPGTLLDTRLFVTNNGNIPLRDVQVTTRSGTDDALALQSVSGTPTKRGDVLASFSKYRGAMKFLADPSRSVIYISVFDKNLVAILDLESLQIVAEILVGAGPTQMALSRDNNTLYVASSAAKQISRVNLATRNMLTPFVLADWVHDVEVGADRLYVLTSRACFGLNEITGAPIGQEYRTNAGGELAISPDRKHLYFASNAISPAALIKLALDGDSISVLETRWDRAENGQDLALSRSGQYVAFAAGHGQYGYKIAQYRTSDMVIVGSFNTGPYPTEIVYSPNETYAMTVNFSEYIHAWSTQTFEKLFTIPTHDTATEIEISPDGKVVVAAFADSLRIYDIDRGLTKNAGDINRNDQIDIGETWVYTGSKVAREGLHEHEITIKTGFSEFTSPHSVAVQMIYEGVSDGVIVMENISGVRLMQVDDTINWVSDDRFEYKDGFLGLKDHHSLSKSDDPFLLSFSYANGTSREVPVYVIANPYPWHNSRLPSDVDMDNSVTPLDVLVAINELNLEGSKPLLVRNVANLTMFDVDADGTISPLDVLAIINVINQRQNGEGEAERNYSESALWMYELDTILDELATHESRRRRLSRSLQKV